MGAAGLTSSATEMAMAGEIGATVQDAALNGWRCFNDSTHYYGPGAAVLVG